MTMVPSEPKSTLSTKGRGLALRLTLIYVALCSGYILVSSRLAAGWVSSIEQFALYEQVKGLAFIFITGGIFHAFAYRLLHRIEAQETELAHKEQALARTEQRALAATLASSVGHDIKNLLSVLSGGVDLLSDPVEQRRQELAASMQKAVGEMDALARRLMVMGNEGFGAGIQTLDLLEAVRDAVEFTRIHHSVRGCDVRVSGTPGVSLAVIPRRIGSMIFNLLINAAEAMNESGRVDIVVGRSQDGGGTIEFHDSGPGVPQQISARVFEPFVTTKQLGTGLGLLSVKLAAEEHGGTVAYERSSRLGGACFRVTIQGKPSGT